MAMDTTSFEIQPIIDLNSSRVCGGEILWRPSGSPPSKEDLEELEDDPKLNIDVTKNALILALNTLSRIQSDAWLSINFPTKYIGNGARFFKSVSKELNDFDLLRRKVGKRLVLELSENDTESIRNIELLDQLSETHSIAIDDFGTGTAPLTHMLKVDFDKVKVDRSIISGCDVDSRKQRFLNWLIGGCHSIGVSVCTEGVETTSELSFLKRAGADTGQGYLWSKSIAVEDFENLAVPAQSVAVSLGQVIGINQ
jgi:EAL domain-containing protein (putative c-di-GMP-specific phosphodiesterase class I)